LSTRRLIKSALKNGIDDAYCFTRLWLLSQKSFYDENRYILDQKRGSGYWLWKPYIILKMLKKMQNGDILIYSDAGIEFISPINDLVDLCQKSEGVLLFQTHGQLNSTWTKRDCFVQMDCDHPEYYHVDQVMGGFSIYLKTEFAEKFIAEWLNYAKNKLIISDLPNQMGYENLPGFREHRHDQSILTNLAVKHALNIYRDPSQWGDAYKKPEFRDDKKDVCKIYDNHYYVNSAYPTLINHHRKKNTSRQFVVNVPYYLLDTLKVCWYK
jgi:hypothetical protein